MDLLTELAILVLAAFVGFEVISKVPNTLHTPLMSGTNAIHGIVLLGGLLLMHEAHGVLEKLILVIAIIFGTINIIGGFFVTDRMLGMFKRKPAPQTEDAEEAAAKPKRQLSGAAIAGILAAIVAGVVVAISEKGNWVQKPHFIQLLYIVAFTLFILGLRGLAGPNTAVQGNLIAAVGMAIAFVATLLIPGVTHGTSTVILMIVGLVLGTAIGVPSARAVKMTAMPQMVALFNGVGGGAVALIAWTEYRHKFGGDFPLQQEIPSLFAAIVGSVSFWGSNIAFGKLQEILPGRPIKVPGQQIVNGVLFLIAVVSAVVLASGTHSQALFIIGILVAAAILGNMVVLPIGGADMPVVISLLNAFTGLSAAATGVALDNTALIVAGMIVGASGTILTNLMAVAMNRSVPAIIAGGFGGGGALPAGPGGETGGTVRSTSAQDVAIQLAYARQFVVVPGYGMAVAQAQHAVRELANELEKRGVSVKYAIHPVAGRMPGHMNVLLAEADVPYDQLKEMDDINPEFPRTDVSLVIGANDVTNPAAKDQPDSPIYGMPILEVDRSQSVIVLKRSMNSGFAGIDNPLFYDEKTALLFGDAKSSVSEITSEVQHL
jgi:NAD(P) transhydrogenase subunit beta